MGQCHVLLGLAGVNKRALFRGSSKMGPIWGGSNFMQIWCQISGRSSHLLTLKGQYFGSSTSHGPWYQKHIRSSHLLAWNTQMERRWNETRYWDFHTTTTWPRATSRAFPLWSRAFREGGDSRHGRENLRVTNPGGDRRSEERSWGSRGIGTRSRTTGEAEMYEYRGQTYTGVWRPASEVLLPKGALCKAQGEIYGRTSLISPGSLASTWPSIKERVFQSSFSLIGLCWTSGVCVCGFSKTGVGVFWWFMADELNTVFDDACGISAYLPMPHEPTLRSQGLYR